MNSVIQKLIELVRIVKKPLDCLSGIPSNLHPGARKYYEEQGVVIPDYLK